MEVKNCSSLTSEVTPSIADHYLSHRNWPDVVSTDKLFIAKLQPNFYKCQLCLRVK